MSRGATTKTSLPSGVSMDSYDTVKVRTKPVGSGVVASPEVQNVGNAILGSSGELLEFQTPSQYPITSFLASVRNYIARRGKLVTLAESGGTIYGKLRG